MSLNFDLKAVKTRLGEARYEEVTTSLIEENNAKQWHTVTNSLIWLSMGVGLGRITEDNIKEWSFRLALIEKIDGPSIQFNDGRKVSITEEDLRNHIGLSTNVSDEKRAAWVKRAIEGSAYRLKLASGAPEDGLAISALDQVNLIHRELLAKQTV